MNTDLMNMDLACAAYVTFTTTASDDAQAACKELWDMRHFHPERVGWVVPKKLTCAPRIRKHRKAEARAWKTLQSRRAKQKR